LSAANKNLLLNIQILFHVTLYEVNNMKKIATAMFEDLHKIEKIQLI